jgi:hypothetical protein
LFSMAKSEKIFSESVNLQKNDRMARDSLRELLRFNEALDNEIARLKTDVMSHSETDAQMLRYMVTSKGLFETAMQTMRTKNGDQGRLAFIQFADSVQDLMGYIHKMRLH